MSSLLALAIVAGGGGGAVGDEIGHEEDLVPDGCTQVALGRHDQVRGGLAMSSGRSGGGSSTASADVGGDVALRLCLDLQTEATTLVSVGPPVLETSADPAGGTASASYGASLCATVDVVVDGPADGDVAASLLLYAAGRVAGAGAKTSSGASLLTSVSVRVRQGLAREEVGTTACVSSTDTHQVSWS